MKETINILFCGDIMPGGVLPYQESYIDSELLDYLSGFDIRIGTLECAIGTNIPPAPEKLAENGGNNNVCYARDEDFFRIKELGFNVVSLGNNHSFDLGEDGLRNTIRLLRENNIGYFGAGFNKQEACKPYILKIKGKSVCLIGCCIKGIAPKSLIAATENTYGVYNPSIDELLEQIASLKGIYDYLIIMPHWGEEHVFFPPDKCVDYAKKMIDAGADAVFGSHSHCISTFCHYKHKPIYFGMGNFLYPDNYLFPPRFFYYPNDSDSLPSKKCVNYPKSVKCPTLCVWGRDSRIGMVVETVFEKKITTRKRLVKIRGNNILSFFHKSSPVKNFLLGEVALPIMNFAIRIPFYAVLFKKVSRISRKIVGRNSDFRKNV